MILLELYSQDVSASQVEIVQLTRAQFAIIVEEQFHVDYGLQYPVTYEFNILQECSTVMTYKKAHFNDNWELIPTKNDTDYFNGEESFRFDSHSNIVYLSASMYSGSDTLFLRIVDESNIPLQTEYIGISEYYDNRNAVVTATIDDIAYWFNPHFINGAKQFQKRKIWVNLGIISDACYTNNTWQDVQDLLNLGYTEASAHSQNHPFIPYDKIAPFDTLEYEVSGCFGAIRENLDLPQSYKSGDKEYIYTWLCPYGQHDNHVDSLLGVEKILVNRLYEPPYFYDWADWDSTYGLFKPLFVSREMGTTDWESFATSEIDTLNDQFDDAYNQNGIYHLVMHPQTVDWNGNYAQQHLDYISQRKDVWYTSLGHLYLYRLMYLNQPSVIVSVDESLAANTTPSDYKLCQNYPNPFNPSTLIEYEIKDKRNETQYVKLAVYNLLGQEIVVLVNKEQKAGSYEVSFNADGLASGIYFYKITVTPNSKRSGNFSQIKKMILIR